MEADHAMAHERFDAVRHAKALDIRRRGARHLIQHRHAARDHVQCLHLTDTQHTIDAFADEIDESIPSLM